MLVCAHHALLFGKQYDGVTTQREAYGQSGATARRAGALTSKQDTCSPETADSQLFKHIGRHQCRHEVRHREDGVMRPKLRNRNPHCNNRAIELCRSEWVFVVNLEPAAYWAEPRRCLRVLRHFFDGHPGGVELRDSLQAGLI